MITASNKLSNVQLELLKTFSYELPDEEIQELKQVLVKFFADRIRKRTGKIWQQKGYSEQTMQDWLNDENQ
ncbi:MAG: hypothetical protein ACK4NY_20920 [Spirosomataceae bacterium]